MRVFAIVLDRLGVARFRVVWRGRGRHGQTSAPSAISTAAVALRAARRGRRDNSPPIQNTASVSSTISTRAAATSGAFQIARFVESVAHFGHRQRNLRPDQRREGGVGLEKIMGEDAFLGAVEAGRVLDRDRQRPGAGHQGPCIRRRRYQIAVGCDHAVGRQRGGGGFGVGDRRALVARQLHDAAQHLDETARDRQVRPCRLRRDVEQHQRALARFGAGHQRRAVGKRRPGALDDVGGRLGQYLPRDGDLARRREVGKRAGLRELGDRLRRRPGQRAAHRAFAGAQADRQQVFIIAGGGQPRTGKAHQRAALLDPVDQPAAAPASGMVPTSAMTIIAGFCSRSCGMASARSALDGSTRSAKGCSARLI